MSIDRSTLLQLMAEELRQVSAGDATLFEARDTVMLHCRRLSAASANGSDPVPLEAVAAFLDGTLDDDSANVIGARAAWDEELMTELMLCLQADESGLPPTPISDDLCKRLYTQAGVLQSSPVLESAPTDSVVPSDPTVAKPVRKTVVGWRLLVAIAASLLLVTGWYLRREDKVVPPTTPDVASSPMPDSATRPESSDDEDAIVAASSESRSNRSDATPDAIAEAPRPREPMIEVPTQVPDGLPQQQLPDTSSITMDRSERNRSLQDGLTWKSINGVLVIAEESAVDASSSQRVREAGVEEGSVTTMASSRVLRTLPLSRAEATLASGGRWVLPGDCLVRVDDDGSVAVERGSLAIVDLPAGGLNVIATSASSVAMTAIDRADCVLRRSAGGLWLDVLRGSVRYGDRVVSNQSLLVEAARGQRDADPATQDAKLDRPRWVDKVVDKISVPRPYLAQLRTSKDVAATLDLQLENSPRGLSQSTLMTLVVWRTALDEQGLFDLVNSPNPVTRQTALSRIAMLTPLDSRHGRVWRGNPGGMTPGVTKTLRDRFVSMWRTQIAGQPYTLTQAQANALVTVLQSNVVAGRATADFLLRRAFNGGPQFDPTWTGTSQARGVAGWRTFLKRAAGR